MSGEQVGRTTRRSFVAVALLTEGGFGCPVDKERHGA